MLQRTATVLALVGSVAAGVPASVSGDALAGAPQARAALATPPYAVPSAAVVTAVQHLSLAQLAGQRVIFSYSGLTPPAGLLQRIRAGEAAGVVFFAGNIQSVRQLASVARELQAANRSSPVTAPLLLMTDQEGGRVRRLPGAPALSEQQIGLSAKRAALASAAGRGAGLNLRSAGLDADLAPVEDVARQPGDFIDQFQRSYGPDAARDGALGADFVRAQQATGVASTAKHFPGLGAARTEQDTDAGPVTLTQPLSAIRSIDERPFRAVIAAGVKLVMLSWAVYPALDRTLPAGLSPKVVQGELRGRLGYRGVTISDSLSAGALRRFGSVAARGLRAARAGDDLLLATNPSAGATPGGAGIAPALAAAIAHGTLSRAGTEQSVERVIALRESL